MLRLRELPKLIILDLSGNPCSSSGNDDYRLYVIFNVRKLKVRVCVCGGGGGGGCVCYFQQAREGGLGQL